jgi:hypothetical protein
MLSAALGSQGDQDQYIVSIVIELAGVSPGAMGGALDARHNRTFQLDFVGLRTHGR